MQITISPILAGQSSLELKYPDEFGSASHLDERDSEVMTDSGKFLFKECWFEGACLFSSEFKVCQHSTIKVRCDSFCWLMNFVMEGEIKSLSRPDQAPLGLEMGHYHTFYCSALDMDLVVDRHTRVFTICLTHRFIRKFLGNDILSDQFKNGEPELLTLVITDDYRHSRFGSLIKDILEAKQPAYIRRIFLEAKILEILSLQLERLENKQITHEDFSHEDIARLQNARDLVEINMQTPCSLIDLARKTGLNDFKLKKGFKALYGHTVFGYLAELRMEMASRLLKEGKSVSEVAEAVGYKNPHHFTAAFKKRFLLLPSQVGKIIMILFSNYLLA